MSSLAAKLALREAELSASLKFCDAENVLDIVLEGIKTRRDLSNTDLRKFAEEIHKLTLDNASYMC